MGELTLYTAHHLPADQNPALILIASKPSQHSQRTLAKALDRIAKLIHPQLDHANFPWFLLRYQHTATIRARLMESYKPASTNLHLSALRGVLKECWRLGLMTADDYHRAIDINNVQNHTLPIGRELTKGEINALFNVCNQDDSPAGLRDASILACLRFGLRRGEIISLDFRDYDPQDGKLLVKGKGRRERTVYLGRASIYIENWLTMRGEEAGALFYPINKGGKLQPQRMSEQAIYNMTAKRAMMAGIKDFSPHDFRRTFAGDMLEAGVDIVTVAKLMGHADVNTTARYDRRPETAKKKSAEFIHIPQPPHK